MSRNKLIYKIVPIFLIVSIFFTSCDVPDISEFSTQSAEMTRSIRQSVKDTGNVLKTASESGHLFEKETTDTFKKHSQNYNATMQPTLETLDSLDAYLDALNALAQANKKSAENSKAVVGAVGNLVTSASSLVLAPTASFEIPGTVINIATGLLAAAEQFRTARSFKRRVNLAADIVEGRYEEITEEVEVKGQKRKVVTFKKICTEEKRGVIENIGRQLTDAINQIKANNGLSSDEKKKRIENEIKSYDRNAFQHGCGVIDLLKFTMQDLKQINNLVSGLIQRNYRENNMDTVILYKSIDENNLRTQKQFALILKHKSLISQIKELDYRLNNETDATEQGKLRTEIRRRVVKDKETLDAIFILDGRVKDLMLVEIAKCDDRTVNAPCANMHNFIDIYSNDANRPTLNAVYNALLPNLNKLYVGNTNIEAILEVRETFLSAQNRMYLAEKDRIRPDYEKTNSELSAMINKQKQLDNALNASIGALNTWMTTHANLRVAVNTKKTLSVANLTAKVKEIMAIIEPEAE